MMPSFIHVFRPASKVCFTTVPQPRHVVYPSLAQLRAGGYIRSIRGRIGKVTKICRRTIDTRKELSDSPRVETVWVFSVRFVDNGERIELHPYVTISYVTIKWWDLFRYTIFKLFNPKLFQS